MSGTQEVTLIRGYVEEVIDKGTRGGSGVRIAGTRYGAYDPIAHGLNELKTGDYVALNWKAKGDFKNIVGKVMKVDDNGNAAPPAPTTTTKSSSGFRQFGTGGGFPVEYEAYEVSLIRREAVNAILGTLKPGTAIKFTEDIKPIADEIVRYVAGWDLVPNESNDEYTPSEEDTHYIPF